MNTAQVTKCRTLLNKAGIDEREKEELVQHFTNNRTKSLRGMTYDETQDIIKYLEGVDGKPTKLDPRKAMQNKILSRAHEMEWETEDGKVDMGRVNQWCINYSKVKKPFNQITYDELPIVLSQFEMAYQDFLKGL